MDENLQARARALINILRMSIRVELEDSYSLNLAEMYLLIDYFSEIDNEITRLRSLPCGLKPPNDERGG